MKKEQSNPQNLSRRDFLHRLGVGAGTAVAMSVMGPLRALAQDEKKPDTPANRMTYRVQHGSGEQISLLGFGMMRLPDNQEASGRLCHRTRSELFRHGPDVYGWTVGGAHGQCPQPSSA